MSAKKKKNAAPNPSPAPVPAAVTTAGPAPTNAPEPFYKRHPKIANAVFAGVCIYVAMIWLLALDQTFHWGIFGPKTPPMP